MLQTYSHALPAMQAEAVEKAAALVFGWCLQSVSNAECPEQETSAGPRLLRFVLLVGVGRFELPTSWSQTKRSNLAELHPDASPRYPHREDAVKNVAPPQ